MFTVFLSSTAKELRGYREAVHQAIRGLSGYRCVRMEDFVATDSRADDYCRTQVAKCDVFVGLLGYFYGSSPRGSALSFTELEYDAAVQNNKPRLMFFATSEALVPAGLEEPLDKRERQRGFRGRVAEERIVDTFSTPDELAGKVVSALRKWEANRPSSARAASEGDVAEPNFGRLVAKLCDRRAQEEDFRDFFLEQCDRRPGSPQAYLIPGEEGECHESLIERLIYRVEFLAAQGEEQEAKAGRVKLIPWQHGGEASQRTGRLIYSVFESLEGARSARAGKSRDLSPAAMDEILAHAPNAYVAIQHDIHAARWDASTLNTISSYLAFWSAMPPAANRAPILIFLSVVFPRHARGWSFLPPGFRAFLGRRQRRRIMGDLKRMERASTGLFRVLAELPAITREDVLEWFRLHQVHDSEDKRIRAVERLFEGNALGPKAMHEIEAFCAEELKAFAREKGRDEQWNWKRTDEREVVFGRGRSDLRTQSASAAL